MVQPVKNVLAATLDTAADVADTATDLGSAVMDGTVESVVGVIEPATDVAKGFIKIPATFARRIAEALRGD